MASKRELVVGCSVLVLLTGENIDDPLRYELLLLLMQEDTLREVKLPSNELLLLLRKVPERGRDFNNCERIALKTRLREDIERHKRQSVTHLEVLYRDTTFVQLSSVVRVLVKVFGFVSQATTSQWGSRIFYILL